MLRGYLSLFLIVLLLAGCAARETRIMEATAYCNCWQCCSWERGSWKYLKLDFWNRYVSEGRDKGRPYSGHTASGTKPVTPVPGLVSRDSLANPWMIPVRTVFPWLWQQKDGTIAADTKYYPFGTRMYVPGWGWGVVADRGGAIKGPDRIDLYFDSHREALIWGRRWVKVELER
ncbi:MAG: 3D domain-containing protein [Desulfobulbaceae bacterium]|nr:3D domain-containing protein [Desulfobulbaceae bacterium]